MKNEPKELQFGYSWKAGNNQIKEKDNESISINDKEVVFKKQDEQIFCTSLDIANVFEKRHDNIIALIDKTIDELREIGHPLGFLNFKESDRTLETSNLKNNPLVDRKYRMYLLTRDGFSLIAMSLTGKKALKWKCDFLSAFNQMEQMLSKEIRSPNKYLTDMMEQIYPKLPQSDYRVDISIKDSLIPQKAKEIFKMSYGVDNRNAQDALAKERRKIAEAEMAKIKALKAEENSRKKDEEMER